MGYFSNGSEGDAYEARYCARCLHWGGGCAVLAVHSIWNYSQFEVPVLKDVLNELIPRGPTGENLACRMWTHKGTS